MRSLADIEADLKDSGCSCCAFGIGPAEHARLFADIPDLLAALEQARSIAVALEQEVAANVVPF
jgi:hypothetical protein